MISFSKGDDSNAEVFSGRILDAADAEIKQGRPFPDPAGRKTLSAGRTVSTARRSTSTIIRRRTQNVRSVWSRLSRQLSRTMHLTTQLLREEQYLQEAQRMADLTKSPPEPNPQTSEFGDPWSDSIWREAMQNMHLEFGEIRLLGISSIRDRASVELGSLYVSLRLESEKGKDDTKGMRESEILYRKGRIVVLGDPGAGKTTLISMLISNAVSRGRTLFGERFGNVVPIPMILRTMAIRQRQHQCELSARRMFDPDILADGDDSRTIRVHDGDWAGVDVARWDRRNWERSGQAIAPSCDTRNDAQVSKLPLGDDEPGCRIRRSTI